MSNISARLLPDPNLGITLNATVFASIFIGYVEDIFDGIEAATMVNNHIQANGGTSLVQAEIDDVLAMKTYYDSLSVVNQALYRDVLIPYCEMLQDDNMTLFTEEKWDEFFLNITP